MPSPVTWADGALVLSERLRADVSGTVQLLTAPPLFIGSQTMTGQVLATSGTDYQVVLDTENADTTGGHRINANEATWYAIIPGWYLAEGFAPLNYTGSSGWFACGIQARQGGTTVTRYGMTIPNASGSYSGCQVAKLCHMSAAGTYGGSASDWISLTATQTAGSSVALDNLTARQPRLMIAWAASSTGTAPLPVPPLDAWPSAPDPVDAAFFNANVRDTLSFLLYPPLMEYALLNGTQALANSTTVPATGIPVALDSATIDTYGAYSTATATWTAPAAGRYYCYGQVASLGDSASLAAGAGLTVTSANYGTGHALTLWGGTVAAIAASSQPTIAVVRRVLRLNAGDTVQLAGYQHDSGGHSSTLTGTGPANCRLITIWRGL